MLAGVTLTCIGIERNYDLFKICKNNLQALLQRAGIGAIFLAHCDGIDLRDLQGVTSIARFCGAPNACSDEIDQWKKIYERFLQQDGAVFCFDTALDRANFDSLGLPQKIKDQYELFELTDCRQGNSKYNVHVVVKKFDYRKNPF